MDDAGSLPDEERTVAAIRWLLGLDMGDPQHRRDERAVERRGKRQVASASDPGGSRA